MEENTSQTLPPSVDGPDHVCKSRGRGATLGGWLSLKFSASSNRYACIKKGQRHNSREGGNKAPIVSLIFGPYAGIGGHRRLKEKGFDHIPYGFFPDYRFM